MGSRQDPGFEDESSGDIIVALFGPSYTESIAIAALTVLLTYLAGSAVSVLQNVMVEKEELAGSIAFWLNARPNTVTWFGPTSVALATCFNDLWSTPDEEFNVSLGGYVDRKTLKTHKKKLSLVLLNQEAACRRMHIFMAWSRIKKLSLFDFISLFLSNNLNL